MIYTPLTKKAMRIAYEAHCGQADKTGIPYIYHPIHLAEQMTDEITVCVALLHDVPEDTAITLEDLAKEGFPAAVLEAVALLTHDPAVPYLRYVRAIRKNSAATAVKLADLRHNCDLTRLDTVDDAARARVRKYKRAIKILCEENPSAHHPTEAL